MKKSDKKIDNAIIRQLTKVCTAAQERYTGFQWLTHVVNYNDFPQSLKILCVYDSDEHLQVSDLTGFKKLIQGELELIGVKIKNIDQHVNFDTEESCAKEKSSQRKSRLK